MSKDPIERRRARRKGKRPKGHTPWYLRPITWKVIVFAGRILGWIFDLFL